MLSIAQKMKFSIRGFFSKCDQICRNLRIWSCLLKKFIMENFIFCVGKPIFLPSPNLSAYINHPFLVLFYVFFQTTNFLFSRYGCSSSEAVTKKCVLFCKKVITGIFQELYEHKFVCCLSCSLLMFFGLYFVTLLYFGELCCFYLVQKNCLGNTVSAQSISIYLWEIY